MLPTSQVSPRTSKHQQRLFRQCDTKRCPPATLSSSFCASTSHSLDRVQYSCCSCLGVKGSRLQPAESGRRLRIQEHSNVTCWSMFEFSPCYVAICEVGRDCGTICEVGSCYAVSCIYSSYCLRVVRGRCSAPTGFSIVFVI